LGRRRPDPLRNGERRSRDRKPQEIIEAFDRERARAREFNRRHEENVRGSHASDRQVLIERRRFPR
jgi:hypothetical protein